MWFKWFPWRFFISRLAQARGFLDPIALLAQFRRFSQPSEVLAPGELLRSGLVLHARGLINSQAIQHNLDWVWPFWVERQFDPNDCSFIPRAFSLTHINLSHRNWTAVGVPDHEEMPLVDPRGLVTPHFDGWSLDAWIIDPEGRTLLPSRLPRVDQVMEMSPLHAVVTSSRKDGMELTSRTFVELSSGMPVCQMVLTGHCEAGASLVVSLRPFNPEGVSFVHDLELVRPKRGWRVNRKHFVWFAPQPEQTSSSCYRNGDVFETLRCPNGIRKTRCDTGMGTAAALFHLLPGETRSVKVSIPLTTAPGHRTHARAPRSPSWDESLAGMAVLSSPDNRLRFLYENAVRTLVLLSPGEVLAGSFTYKRFWFRDAVFVAHALLCAGLLQRAHAVLSRFPRRQTRSGYFLSQNGEWDSNGQVLWVFHRYLQLTGQQPDPSTLRAAVRGAHWLIGKRGKGGSEPHAGLLPPGFSAEHLGPNDYYYWDDFWGVAGLSAAADIAGLAGCGGDAARLRRGAAKLMDAVETSLRAVSRRLGHHAMPSSPYRRMDSSAIGSLAAGYPLELWPASDPRLLATADYLYENCRVKGAFFHDMTHSGINPYLSLHIAQIFLRSGDPRFAEIASAIAALASSTGQWPEAVHPSTLGGCMGDGQHAWAAAEWVAMVRNSFVREEADAVVLCAGLTKGWILTDGPVSFGPTPTRFGPVTVSVEPGTDHDLVSWKATWRQEPPTVRIAFPGRAPVVAAAQAGSVSLPKEGRP